MLKICDKALTCDAKSCSHIIPHNHNDLACNIAYCTTTSQKSICCEIPNEEVNEKIKEYDKSFVIFDPEDLRIAEIIKNKTYVIGADKIAELKNIIKTLWSFTTKEIDSPNNLLKYIESRMSYLEVTHSGDTEYPFILSNGRVASFIYCGPTPSIITLTIEEVLKPIKERNPDSIVIIKD